MYPKNTLEYTSGYSRIQKYVCILPRTPEYMTDYRIQVRIQSGYSQDTDQDTSIGQSIRNRSESNQNTDGIHSGYKSEGGIRLYPDALAEFERTKEAPFGFLEVFWVFATHFELFDLGVCECHR